MAISNQYVLHGIVNSTTMLSQISNARAVTGIDQLVSYSAGLPFPLFAGNLGQRPGYTFECSQIKTIIDLCGLTIVNLTGNNTDFYFKAATNLGVRVADATTSHLRFRSAQAGLYPMSLRVGHRQEAYLSCRICMPYDGTNEPLVPAGSLALSGTPGAADHWVQGPVYLNTVQLPGVQEMTIDFGNNLLQAGGDGELYDTFVFIETHQPKITIRGYNVPWATYGLNGTALTAGSFYLRKVSPTGRVANGTASHIKLAATAGIINVQETAAGGNQAAMTTIEITPVGADAATYPLTITGTAIAITT
jgi:hypothetical protein